MNVYLFSFTQKASLLSLSLHHFFTEQKIHCISYTMEKYAVSHELTPFSKPLKEHVSDCFQKENAIIFISACGICVRSIAPFIHKKTSDPCVLVIDEQANFVISLLSGHIGGGNEFAIKTADFLNAAPVISTATDLNHKFAVDVFSKKNNLIISDMTLAKEVSASLLDQIPVGIAGIVPDGELPEGITFEKEELGISISAFSSPEPFSRTLHLIPKQVVLGVGCKRNTEFKALKHFIEATLSSYQIHLESIAAITSIDIKKEEKGLIALAEHFSVPFVTYTANELLQVPGKFSSSSFVKSVTGVDNVCERSTLAYSKAEELFLPKTAHQGMTVAISLLPLSLHY